MRNNVLVVAFDGLDKELIEEFGLENVDQKEFGTIDNTTEINEVKTGELFASFITGENSEEHGITGVMGWNSRSMDAMETIVPKREPFYSIAAKVKDWIKCITGAERGSYDRSDLDTGTIFDSIPDSVALHVPVYNPSPILNMFGDIVQEYGIKTAEREVRKEFERRQMELLEELEEAHRFLMVQFHVTDFMNHLFGDEVDEREKLRAMYEEVDDLAGEILEEADRYDTVIFFSDHGLPTDTEHNENAFYSCNHELFPDKIPHITDFRKKIEELVGEETSELDI